MSEAFRKQADERAQEVAFSYLMRVGVPTQPAEVVEMVAAVFQAGIAWAVSEGYISLNESGQASDEERATTEASLEAVRNLHRQLADSLSGESPYQPTGQYL